MCTLLTPFASPSLSNGMSWVLSVMAAKSSWPVAAWKVINSEFSSRMIESIASMYGNWLPAGSILK